MRHGRYASMRAFSVVSLIDSASAHNLSFMVLLDSILTLCYDLPLHLTNCELFLRPLRM